MSKGFQRTATIETELRKAGIATDDTSRRFQIATAILQTHEYFGQDQAARLRARLATDYVGMALEEALEATLLSGAWIDLDREVKAMERAAPEPAESAESHLRHVTESNPYGWQKPELQRVLDHDIPGQWNAFRQAYNLTARGSRDHRIRGCTRWDVLGRDGQPSAEFDAVAVGAAQAKEVAAVSERHVYGENQ